MMESEPLDVVDTAGDPAEPLSVVELSDDDEGGESVLLHFFSVPPPIGQLPIAAAVVGCWLITVGEEEGGGGGKDTAWGDNLAAEWVAAMPNRPGRCSLLLLLFTALRKD
jgi:hypothetical protein